MYKLKENILISDVKKSGFSDRLRRGVDSLDRSTMEEPDIPSAVFMAAMRVGPNSHLVIESWLRSGGNPNALGSVPTFGMMPAGMMPKMPLLSLVCATGNTELIDLLVRYQADVNARDPTGGSPLNAACTHATPSNLEAMGLLLDSNADVGILDKHGQEPLYSVCECNHTAGVRLLLARGANVSASSNSSWPCTALMCAVNHSTPDVTLIQVLLEARADVHARNSAGRDALSYVRPDHHRAISLLLKQAVSPAIGAPLVGQRVRVSGLAARPALNGCEGSCLSYDADKGRYTVLLVQDAQAASGACMALQPKNLTAVATPEGTLLGTAVRVVGLQAKPELNGRTGTAVDFDAGQGRYRVLLRFSPADTTWVSESAVSRGGTIAVRATNLEPIVQLDALPKRVLGNEGLAGLAATQCAICMVDYANGDELLTLPCAHEFHVKCAGAWLEKASSCPICRALPM